MPEFILEPKAIPIQRVGIVDADSIMFLLGWKLNAMGYLTQLDVSKLKEPPDTLYTEVNTFVDRLKTFLQVDACEFHFTASGKNKALFEEFYNKEMQHQFRTTLGFDYKSNRSPTAELPYMYHLILRIFLTNYLSYMHDTHEADDAICLLHKLNSAYIVSSNDKDVYNQIVGKAYQYDKRQSFTETTKEEANMFPYLQAITGDPTDGFAGAKGLGIKAAKNFIRKDMSPYEMWEGVVAAFNSVGMDKDNALWNMRMANMHQLSDDGSLNLFEPPVKGGGHVFN